MIGMSLLVVVVLAVFQVFPLANNSVNLADRTTHANALARELMEARLRLPYSSLDLGEESDIERLEGHTQRYGSSLSTEYRYQVKVELPDPDRDIKEITVTVSWKEGSGAQARPHSVSLQSRRGNLW